ncbi:hypothetical protein VN24_09275 [Paenibacillus beijingensis]|uniref:HTH tetR-type domain-containing protein n=2 Tax=Paenibacillus beijingensis TaxID=1126833 RepID=A0A0D5NI11_9BACL|nr:hypothetical protein VN24_09275 [Paenibacillus beijingensis]
MEFHRPAESAAETGRREQKDQEYRLRILDAVRRLIDRNGFDTVTMHHIAKEAAIGQGTLYRRYEHLGEIYSDLLRTSGVQFLDELEAFAGRNASSMLALDQVYEVIVRITGFMDENAELLSAISCRYAGKKSFLPSKLPLLVRMHNIFATLLSRASAQGETNEIDVTLISNCLLAALAPEQYFYHRKTLGYTKDRFLAGIRGLFIEGLKKETQASGGSHL